MLGLGMNSKQAIEQNTLASFSQAANYFGVDLQSQGQMLGAFLGKIIGVSILCLTLWIMHGQPAAADDYNKEFLIGVDLSGRVLVDSSFTKANLRESNLSGADLRGVSFFGANLESANLAGADLRNATLDTARFTNANLTNANLEGAFAFNAKFDGATIDGADFTNVDVRQDAQTILCKQAKGTNPITKRKTRDTLNCP